MITHLQQEVNYVFLTAHEPKMNFETNDVRETIEKVFEKFVDVSLFELRRLLGL